MEGASFLLPGLATGLKVAIGISVGMAVTWLFRLSGVERMAVILATTLPASLLTIMIAREHRLDGQFIAAMLSLAFPLSLVVSLVFTTLAPPG